MANVHGKLYAIGGASSIEYYDANNPTAGWQSYGQAAFAAEKRYVSCLAMGQYQGTCFQGIVLIKEENIEKADFCSFFSKELNLLIHVCSICSRLTGNSKKHFLGEEYIRST